MEQSPEKSQQGKHYHFSASLAPPILSSGTVNSFSPKANARQGPKLHEALRPWLSNAHTFPEHQTRQHLAQHRDKQEKAPGATSGPPVMMQAAPRGHLRSSCNDGGSSAVRLRAPHSHRVCSC